jgi:hypothetical protein
MSWRFARRYLSMEPEFFAPEKRFQHAMSGLRRLKPAAPGALSVYLLRDGDLAKVIMRVAKELQCDLVAFGAHGRTVLHRLIIGSVADKRVAADRLSDGDDRPYSARRYTATGRGHMLERGQPGASHVASVHAPAWSVAGQVSWLACMGQGPDSCLCSNPEGTLP